MSKRASDLERQQQQEQNYSIFLHHSISFCDIVCHVMASFDVLAHRSRPSGEGGGTIREKHWTRNCDGSALETLKRAELTSGEQESTGGSGVLSDTIYRPGKLPWWTIGI
jgi:hypothetical protein